VGTGFILTGTGKGQVGVYRPWPVPVKPLPGNPAGYPYLCQTLTPPLPRQVTQPTKKMSTSFSTHPPQHARWHPPPWALKLFPQWHHQWWQHPTPWPKDATGLQSSPPQQPGVLGSKSAEQQKCACFWMVTPPVQWSPSHRIATTSIAPLTISYTRSLPYTCKPIQKDLDGTSAVPCHFLLLYTSYLWGPSPAQGRGHTEGWVLHKQSINSFQKKKKKVMQ
jgi:hypothetical protein